MNKYFLANLFIKITTFFGAVMAQNPDQSQQIPALFDRYHQNYPQEKIYLHLDKPFYGAGDNIWFSAYLFDGRGQGMSPLSRTLYVELIDDQQQVSQRISLLVDSLGKTHGDFRLPDSLEAGNYRIRAYTNWMRNRDMAYFFDQTFPIYNARAEAVLIQPDYVLKQGENLDTVRVFLTFKDILNKSTANISFNYEFTKGKKFLAQGSQKTDGEGTTLLELLLPKESKIRGSLLLHLKGQYDEKPFKKTFSILNNPQIDVQFFPEGGDLVAGLGSRIAFKVTDETGRGVNAKGIVVDATGKEIAKLQTQYLGMGQTYFVPQLTTYEAIIELENGQKINVPFPKVLEKGCVFRLDNSMDRIRAYIFQQADNLADSMTIIGQSNHQIVYFAKFKPTQNFTYVIPKDKFPTGIVQFTLFDQKNQPQAERLIFSRKDDLLKIKVETDKAVYKKREKVSLTVSVTDSDGEPVEGNFSLAVTDSETVQPDSSISQNIVSYLLLNSDLKGFIEKPDYYFSGDKMADRNLDLLLMTQGWRRFLWKEVLAMRDSVSAEFYAEQGIILSGTVKKVLNNKPVENGTVVLSLNDEKTGFHMLPTVTNEKGKYIFADIFYGEQTIFLQARNTKGGEFAKITLDSITQPLVNERLMGLGLLNVHDAKALEFMKADRQQFQIDQTFRFELDDKTLDEITIKGQRAKPEDDIQAIDRPIYAQANHVIKMDNINTGQTNLLQTLQGRLPGMQVMSDGMGGFNVLIRGISSFMGGGSPLFLLDNMPVDASMINSVPPTQVDRVEILKGANAAIFGSRGANGVISVYTKKGYVEQEEHRSNVIRTKIQGFYDARQFYAPNYETPKPQHSKPDLRTSIFWTPQIRTNAEGKAKIEFYHSDNISNFRMVVEGADEQGGIGRGIGTYQSKEEEK